MAQFLTALSGDQLLWACVDPDSLCSAPLLGERRFQAYLAPFVIESDARQAMLAAGVDPSSIGAEAGDRRKRARRG